MQETHCTLTMQVPVELKDAFVQAAKAENMKTSQIILDFMQDYAAKRRSNAEYQRERLVREKNMREATASVRLEGYEPSEFAMKIGQLFIDGHITRKEHIQMIRTYHGLTPNKE